MAEDLESKGNPSPRAPLATPGPQATPDAVALRPADDYEAKYMAGEGVIYRDKIKAPKTFFAVLALPMVIEAFAWGAVALQDKPVPLPIYLLFPFIIGFLALIGILFSVLRVTVTRREVLVQYGLFGPKIPLEAIESSEAVAYDWKAYGGWGIRRGRDGSTAYNMMGDAGRAVRIVWKDAKGKLQTTLVASPNPDVLARAIQGARSGASPKLRVPAPTVDAEFEAEAEVEAEAVLGEENKRGGARG